ncbi:MAG TPA: UDP-N-acetylmuramate dehydrogenase [Hyphomicrobiaceae bacterium]|nr:UDP-N-acetylmuramate dehydrogenase [Hyphomicrobiaceae bacterium]
MSFPDITGELAKRMPELRGSLSANVSMNAMTWFRVGGDAQVLYRPADEADLAYFRGALPRDIPVLVIGLASNLLVRDGGVPGIVIRMGRGFSNIEIEEGQCLRAGVAVPDVKVARAAADAGIAGLAFYRGIPGSIGGALRMNAGAHGTETKDVLVEARAVDTEGGVHVLSNADMGFTYRHCGISDEWIFTQALFRGRPGATDEIIADMNVVADYRETHQPTRERTGGSTFKNPPGHSAWKLIDEAGCRGFRVGGAVVSEKHCNFLINDRDATGQDIERLGETVRARVMKSSGILLEWEIKRIGVPRAGEAAGEALALS